MVAIFFESVNNLIQNKAKFETMKILLTSLY
jgi:hypothetical protein